MSDTTKIPSVQGLVANQPIVAMVLAGAFVAFFGLTLLGAFLKSDTTLIQSITETLKSIVMIIVGFFFGSSNGSQAKDATIAGQLPAQTDTKV